MSKKKFAAIALDQKHATYVVHVGSFSSDTSFRFSILELNVYTFRRPQISSLIAEEASTKVSNNYVDFADKFFPSLVSKPLEHTGINNHTIKLVDGQQPPYRPIYSLWPVELETLKVYIKTNLDNGFIRPSKSPADAPILFKRKSDSFHRLCVNYSGLYNLTIKNRLPLVGELLDKLERARRFTQLDLTITYYWVKICEGDK